MRLRSLLVAAAVALPVAAFTAFGGPGLAPQVAAAQAPASPPAATAAAEAPAAAAAPAAAPAAPALPDFSAMVERYGPAVVQIDVTANVRTQNRGGGDPFGPFFRGLPFPMPEAPPQLRGQGSGFIVSSDGVILTNAHVVANAKQVTVRLTDRREFEAKVLGADERSDVAVVKIEAQDLPVVKLGDPQQLKVGEWVVAIGAPFGLDNSVTVGIVSAKGRTTPDGGYVPFIQTDAAVNPGNSGGPLFNLRGEVVGINSQIYSRTGGYMGVSFAIPIDVAQQVSHQLQTNGRVSYAKLGVAVQGVNQALARSFGLDRPRGALISSVEPRSAAERAGLQPGDVVVAVDGKPLAESSELPREITTREPGSKVGLTIWRDGKERKVTVQLDALEPAQRTAAAAQDRSAEDAGRLGLAVRPLTPQEQRAVGADGGLLVQQAGGPAAEAGIRPGDVVLAANGTRIGSVEELRTATSKAGRNLALLVQRGDTRIFVPVALG